MLPSPRDGIDHDELLNTTVWKRIRVSGTLPSREVPCQAPADGQCSRQPEETNMCIRLRLPRKSMDAHRPPNGTRARSTSIGLPPTSAGANLISGGPENSACVARKPSIAPPREAVLPHKVLGPRRATESLGFAHNAGIGPRHGRQARETDRP